MSQSGESKYGGDIDLRELNEHLKSLYFDVRTQLKTREDSSELIKQIQEFEQYAEALSELPAELNLGSSNETVTATTVSSRKTVNGQVTNARRRKNSSYDFLLLEAFRWRDTYGPVGQSSLLKLTLAFDTNTKKSSLVAKLNRWKNDKEWLRWSHPDDISITPDGEAERDRLFPTVKRDGDFEGIFEAFSNAWSITVNLG